MRLKKWFGRRSESAAAPRLTIAPESHAGHAGYSVFEDGKRVAWGANQTAALAAYQVGRAA
jgi:hypothetical protein